jgi:hypothetical protein
VRTCLTPWTPTSRRRKAARADLCGHDGHERRCVHDRVTSDMVQGLPGEEVLSTAADDDRQLGFPIHPVPGIVRYHHLFPRTDNRRRRKQKEIRLHTIWNLRDTHFLQMIDIIRARQINFRGYRKRARTSTPFKTSPSAASHWESSADRVSQESRTATNSG